MTRGPRAPVALVLALAMTLGALPATAGDRTSASPLDLPAPLVRAEAAGAAALPAVDPAPHRSHRGSWIALGTGIALTASSFFFAQRADRAYADYKSDLDPARIQSDYDRAVRDDRIGTTMLLAGQVAFAAGLYWRLVRHPARRLPDSGRVAPARSPLPELRLAASGRRLQLALAMEF